MSAACVLAAMVMPVPVRAASPGVHVDPNSPPGKEYAIPLQSARGQQGGPPAPNPPAGQAPPGAGPTSPPTTATSGLFGAGITPARHKRRPAAKAVAPVPAPAVSPAPTVAAPDNRRSTAAAGGSTAMFWVGAALVVLVPGLAVGFGVRRWRQA